MSRATQCRAFLIPCPVVRTCQMDEGMDVDGGLDLATMPQEIPIRTTISSSIAENLGELRSVYLGYVN